MTPERERIEQLIPHRPPMLLVDRIVAHDVDQITCEKTYRPDEHFLQGHYPDFPVVPGVILCESALQSGALLLALKGIGGEGVPVVTRMDGIRLKRMVRPGETLQFAVQIDQTVPPAWYLSAKITAAGKHVARLEFACTLVKQLEPGISA